MRQLKPKLANALAGLVLALLSMSASAQEATDVHARLRLAEAKTSYRIGEPVRLILELTADREGYVADITADTYESPTDQITVSPDSGINHWAEEYMRGAGGYRDYFNMAALKVTPTIVEVMLNDSLRFDRPGKYFVKVTTRRASPAAKPTEPGPPVTLTTNEVAFEIEPISDAEEEQEVKRISGLIDAARGWQAEEAAARQLSYLTGDASAREKVRRFLSSDGKSGNYHGRILYGLYIARNRGLILQLLESAMRDPNVPVTSGLLGVVTRLRLLRETAGAPVTPMAPRSMLMPNVDPRDAAIRDAYVTELAAGLEKRSGKSQTITAMTILMNLPQDAPAAKALSAQARRILISQFDSLHPYDQEYLLRVKWDEIHDNSLVSSLKKMLLSTGGASKNVHDTALMRLLEIAPAEARPFVVAEIKDPMSLVDREILGSLPDKTLPEVDSALLEQVRRFAAVSGNSDRVRLPYKTALAARYASQTIYANLLEIYRAAGDKLPVDARAGFLAYFSKHNEEEGLGLLEQTLQALPPGQDFNVLPEFSKLYFSDAVDDLLRRRLESDVQETASTAAYLISLHGGAADQKLLEQRLERWRQDWANRIAEANANYQGRIESELISALIRSKTWKLSPERVKDLQRSCLTEICKQNHRVQ